MQANHLPVSICSTVAGMFARGGPIPAAAYAKVERRASSGTQGGRSAGTENSIVVPVIETAFVVCDTSKFHASGVVAEFDGVFAHKCAHVLQCPVEHESRGRRVAHRKLGAYLRSSVSNRERSIGPAAPLYQRATSEGDGHAEASFQNGFHKPDVQHTRLKKVELFSGKKIPPSPAHGHTSSVLMTRTTALIWHIGNES